MPNIGPTEVIIGLFVGLILATVIVLAMRAVSPSPKHCLKILRRWGIEQPSQEQSELAARHFRHRQRLYIPVFIVAAIALGALTEGGGGLFLELLLTVLAGLLIGELGATLRPTFGSRRSAALVRRGVTDLVPRFALISFAVVAGTGLAAVVVNLLTQLWVPWDPDILNPWIALAGLVGFSLAGGAVVWLSLIRGPLFDDGVLDAALRIRSARVSTGVSLLLVTGITMWALFGMGHKPPMPNWIWIADGAGTWLVLPVVAIAVTNWVALLNPMRKARLVKAYR